MTPSLLRSKKATCLCSGVSSPLYTSAMEEEEEEEDPSTSTTRSLLPGPSTERSTAVTRATLAPRRTCRIRMVSLSVFLAAYYLPVSAAALPAMEVAGGRDHATTPTTTKAERREGSVEKQGAEVGGALPRRKEEVTRNRDAPAPSPLKAVWCVSDVAGDREDGVERNRGQFRFRSVETDAVCGCVGGVA